MKKNNLKAFLSSPKAVRVAVIAGLSAIVLIFLSSYMDCAAFSDNSEKYSQELSSQLHGILSSIEGVGEVRIFLTIDNTGENVYQQNTDTKLKSITPTVRGVVIVCEGGDDPLIRERVMSAVTRSLAVTSDKVSITKLK